MALVGMVVISPVRDVSSIFMKRWNSSNVTIDKRDVSYFPWKPAHALKPRDIPMPPVPMARWSSSTFKDYLLPLSTDVGAIDVLLLETPARGNPLGIKGVGESGAVGVAPAVA